MHISSVVKIILSKQKLLLSCPCYALLFLTILFQQISFSQLVNTSHDKYRVIHWGLDEGLSQGETYHVIKDANGFLWIGTRYGLNRFDGNTFKVFLHERNKNRSLTSNRVINGLVEDSLHNIWIGSEDRGVSRYNIKTEDFTNFFPDSTKDDDGTIVPFWSTKNDVLCIERESLITAYNIHTSQKKVLADLHGFEKTAVGPSFSYSVYNGSSNEVWCLVVHPNGKAALLEVSLSTNKKNSFLLPHYSTSDYFEAEAMCYDAGRKCIWINGNEGLLQFTLIDKQFHHINALSKYEQVKDYGRYVGITLDKQGRVWFATHPLGIIIYNPDDESVSFPFPSDPALQNEVGDANAHLYCDRDNIVWSGFWLNKGIDGIFPFKPIVTHYAASAKKDSLNSNLVVQAMDAGEDRIWVGTREGIFILDKSTGIFRVLKKKDLPGIQTNGFMGPHLIDTVKQKAWLATEGGVFRMDMHTKKCTPVIFKTVNSVMPSNMVMPKPDGHQIFYASSIGVTSQKVYILNLDSDTAREILSFTGAPFDIFYTMPARNHFLFLRGRRDENGNRTYKNNNGRWVVVHTPIDNIRWTYITYIKENDTYWVAGENQLFRFDKNFHLIKIYSKDDGLPELPVVGLISDNNGNIWFHTDRSIEELNVATGQIRTLSEADGFAKQNFELLPFADKDASGNIYYGGGVFGNGFHKISPGYISIVSSVYLKSLKINQKPFQLRTGINYTDTLSLKYNQAKIEIETGVIDFYSKGKSGIRYKLEGKGMNGSWQYAPYYYTIRYDGLHPGSYELILQASNLSNEFNGPEKRLFIYISPAFWQTWWFRIMVAIFIIILIYAFMRWRIQRRFRLQLEQSEKERQLAELKQKATELEMQALRAQMNPHFIFNSLNSINRFILQNNREQASEYLTKFSKLVRLILQNSQASLITLDSELESLQLYLNLEALRFNYHFDYKISVPKDMDISALQVPPLILQPYVENAIWHGLMHKEEKGNLDVEVSEEDNYLFFKITDNGIGREKAAALSSKSATKHKSMGLRITAHRIAIIQNSQTMGSPVTINDLVNADGSAAGTEVIIKMPVIYD
jgi:ligand-binding sensor domain-containing protein